MDPEIDDLDETILLNGIPVASPDAEWTSAIPAPEPDDADRPILSFREIDGPSRDFQPRLFRFGEAA